MASDVRRELTGLDSVHSVTVKLGEHFASSEVEKGAGPGKTFAEAFPDSGPDTLEETRRIFLLKGYFTRQERLLRGLEGHRYALRGNRGVAGRRYGLDPCRGPDSFTIFGAARGTGAGLLAGVGAHRGRHGPSHSLPEELETYYIRARTTRLAMEANGSLCSAMLQSRNANWIPLAS